MLKLQTLAVTALFSCTQLVQAIGLSELYDEAVIADPRLVSGKAEITISEARQRQSLANLLPQASLRSTLSKNKFESGNADAERYRGKRHVLTLSQTLYNRERWLDRKYYGNLVEQRKALLNDIRSSVALDITQRYVETLSQENALTLIQAELESSKIQSNLLQTRFKRQLALKTDVLDVKTRILSLQVDEIEASNNVRIARESLAELVNREVAEPLNDFSDELSYQSIRSLEEWVKHALENSPMLYSIQKEIDAANNDVSKQKAAHLPSVDFQFTAQKSNIGYENSPSSDTKSLAASFNLTIPIYSGGSVSAGTAERRGRLIVIKQRYEQYRRELKKNVREAYLNTDASWQRIDASKQAMSAAKETHDAMSKGFKFGTVTVLDVLDALNRKLEALLSFKRAQYDFVVSYIQLQQLAGTLDKQLIDKTSSWQEVE
jgi:outer membrane protein